MESNVPTTQLREGEGSPRPHEADGQGERGRRATH